MMRSIWYLGVETLLLVFLPLYMFYVRPDWLQWRVPFMAVGLLYVAIVAHKNVWGWKEMGFSGWKLNFNWLAWLTVLAGVGLVVVMTVFPELLMVKEFVSETYGLSPWWSIVAYGTLSVPLQELLFRGFYIPRLKLVSNNAYFVVLYSALIFGLMHAPFANKWLGLSTMLMGIVWSWYVYKYRTLYPVILSHAILGGIIMAMTLLR